MKRTILIMLAGCLMLAVGCKKEEERDQLYNTVWRSGQYSENSDGATLHGVVYYGDGDACRELLEFSYGWADRYYEYYGEKIKFFPGGLYEINSDNTFTIPKDTTHIYKIEENHIVSYYNDGRKDGVFHRIK